MYHPRVREILPATSTSLPLVHVDESGRSLSLPLPAASLLGDVNPTGLQENGLASCPPSGPSGSTCGFTSASTDLALPFFEEPPLAITPYFGGPPSSDALSDPALWQGHTPRQISYMDQYILSVLASSPFPKVTRPLQVPLSFLGAPNLQISHTTPELEMAL